MSAEDYMFDDYDDLHYQNDSDPWIPKPQYRFVCKYCGQKELKWKKQENGWRLFDKQGVVHKCPS